MKKQIVPFLITAILGIVIGLLLHPVIWKTESQDIYVAPDSTFMSGEPDTFWVEQDTVYLPEYVYQDTGSTEIIVDTVYVMQERPVIRSYKIFDHGDFVLSEIWVNSPTRIYDIDNAVVVSWQDHYDLNYKPQVNRQLSKAKSSNLLKGLAAGGIFTAGLMSGDWRIAAGATLVGGGIIIIF